MAYVLWLKMANLTDRSCAVLPVQELKPKTKIGISGQFDATNPDTKPKVGFAFDLKN